MSNFKYIYLFFDDKHIEWIKIFSTFQFNIDLFDSIKVLFSNLGEQGIITNKGIGLSAW